MGTLNFNFCLVETWYWFSDQKGFMSTNRNSWNLQKPVSISVEDNIDQYDSSRGGNGRVITRAEFPDRLIDLCEGIEEHEHESGAQMAGTVYFPVGEAVFCDTLSAGVTVNSRVALPWKKRMNNELQHRLSITNPNWTLLIFVIKDLESVSRELTSYLYWGFIS